MSSTQDMIMNPDMVDLTHLKNDYFVLRHGQSEANEQSIIVSNPTVGINAYGLTPAGRAQVQAALLTPPVALDDQLKIISSDFLRARESAAIVATSLDVSEPVQYRKNLRERFFGELDGQSDSRYIEVWKHDRMNATHNEFSVEPVMNILERSLSLLDELEARYQGAVILLVAHGDVLQILETAFVRIAPARHRQLPVLEVAQIRQLSPTSLA